MPPVAGAMVTSNITIIPAQEAFLVDAHHPGLHQHGVSRLIGTYADLATRLVLYTPPFEGADRFERYGEVARQIATRTQPSA